MRIKCHSFLNIYIRKTLYGRDFENEKKLCDGEKPDDIKGVDDESSFCQRHMGDDIVNQCQGDDYCIIPVTGDMDRTWQKKFDPTCAPLKKELRVEYICGKGSSIYYVITDRGGVFPNDYRLHRGGGVCRDPQK